MIQSFADKDTEALWHRRRSRIDSTIAGRAYDKLLLLNSAVSLDFLRVPPSHHLERLSGGRKGQHSIRINQKWRLCFRWDEKNVDAYDVEITDYH